MIILYFIENLREIFFRDYYLYEFIVLLTKLQIAGTPPVQDANEIVPPPPEATELPPPIVG